LSSISWLLDSDKVNAGNSFDEKKMDDISINDFVRNNFNKLNFEITKSGQSDFLIICHIDDLKINSFDLKALLRLDDEKKFLSESDHNFINYLVHRIPANTQSYYKISNDFEIIFNFLKNSSLNVFFNGEPAVFSQNNKKLDIELFLNDEGNAEFLIIDDAEYIRGLDKMFFVSSNIFYQLSDKIPVSFYVQLISHNNIFSLDAFFEFQKKYMQILEQEHNIRKDENIIRISNLKVIIKTAPLVLEIDKTQHFLVVELKYKINDQKFRIDNYKYADNVNWLEKTNLICTKIENDTLVRYESDINISEDYFDGIFKESRISYQRYLKSKFRIILPLFLLNHFIEKVVPCAEKIIEIEYIKGNKLELADGVVKFEIDANLNSKIDLLEFKVKFRIEDDFFDLDFIKDLLLKNRKYVQLKNDKTVNVENIRDLNKWIEFLKQFNFNRNNGMYKSSSFSALELDRFLEDFKNNVNVISNSDYKTMIQEIKNKNNLIEDINMPENIDGVLRNYQKLGVQWIYFLQKYNFGGILADEMGLGKTLQALTALKLNPLKTHIVICPKSLVYNWEYEAKKYFPELKVLVIDGDNEKRKRNIPEMKNYDVIITSYSMIQKDYQFYIDNDFVFGYQILDEAHYVKNINTLSAKAVRLINAKNRLLITGTPIENNLNELYAAFDFIMPNYLGSRNDFSKDFISKIERNNLIAIEILQAKIRPFILRRTKKEVLTELPDKQEQIVYSEMTNRQTAIYMELLNRVKQEVNELVKNNGFEKSRIQILSALLKLRQLCNHPGLADKVFLEHDDISGKYAQFKTILSETIDNGDKVLIFSQFTSMLDIMENDMIKDNVKYVRLDGQTKNRQDVVNKFNEDDTIKVFLLSLKAGGVGLNLTSANTVMLYDPWWNPMVERQAKDRAHRIGQKNKVKIYKFITKNSIEEKILKLQEVKGNLFDNLIVENSNFVKKLEWDDLADIFE